jgi:uncharacterized protein DUF4430
MPRRGAAVAFALLLLGVALAAAGCGLGPGSKVGSVDLTVTRDFGATKVTEASGEANESDTVMRFLEKEAEIETRYGGGYVKSIDGLEESERDGHPYDWFFWVNGVISPTGAAEVPLEGGEKIWWDIHNWGASEGSPAVVGSWPAPFTTGWEGHEPVVEVECHVGGSACGTVEAALEREGAEVTVATEASIVEGSAPPPKPAIQVLVGPWEKLRSLTAGELIEKGPGESGVYAEFEYHEGTRSLVGLEELGERARTFGADAGLVAATRHFEGPPIWLVTGATDAGVQAAAAALDAADLRDHFAVAIEAGKVTPLPLSSGSE